MPLRKQKQSIVLAKGIEGKIDHKALPPDTLITLENGRFDKIGAVNKRRGFTIIDEASSDLIDYKGSLVSRNIERGNRAGTGIITPATVLAYGSQKFVGSKGYSDGIDYTMMPVSKGSEYRQEDSQVAISSDGKWACITFTDVVWDQTNDKKSYNKRVSIVDRENNTLVESDIKVGAAKYSGNQGRRMRPIWLDSKFYIFGEDELALKFWILDPTQATIQLKNAAGNSAQAGTQIINAATYSLASSSTFVTTVASFDVVAASNTRYAFLYTKYYTGSAHQNWLYLVDTDDHSFTFKANESNASLQGHLAIHRSTVTGTNANKISVAMQNGTNLYTSNVAETFTGDATAFSAGTVFGLGTDNIWRGFFRDSINPRYTSDQDVQLIWEAGKGAVTGEAGQYLIRLIDGYHDSLTQTVLNNRVISSKARIAFGLGRGPITLGTYHDDNPTANTAVSTAPVNTISLWDTDTNDNAQRYSTGVSNNANNATYMFSGGSSAASYTTSGSNERLTVDFEPPIVYSSHVKFWQLAGSGTFQVAINGGSLGSTGSTSTALITVHSGSGTLSKLEFFNSGSVISVISILVDGSPLFDEILSPWERDTLPVATFKPEWISDCLQTASVTGATAHLNGEAVAVPVGHAFERFGLAGDIVLNSTVQLFDFRRYNEERIDVPAPSTAMLHDVLYIADRGLFQYDGKKFYSVGFSDRPAFGITLVTSAGNLGNGVYYYKVVYEWVDAQGNLHQSEPSTGITVTTDGSNEKVTVDIADLDIGGDGGLAARQDTKMAIYRTQVNGSIFNNIMSIALGNERQAAGDAATGIITVVDNISDAIAATGKFLYTDGGEMANKTPPFSARYVVAHRERLFVIGKNDVVYFSKLAKDGFGIGFNENLFVKTPDNISDPPTALGSMDGNLVVFTERSVYMVGGEGPDNTGAGGFYEAKKVPSNVGAVKGSPVKLINDGLIFVSQNRTGCKIWLLGRNMAVTYIGAGAEDFLNPDDPYIVRDIAVDSKQDSVIFLLSQVSGTASGVKMLVYNYVLKQWGTDKLEGTDSAGAGGSLALSNIKEEKQIYVGLKDSDQDPVTYVSTTGYKDNSNYVPMKIKTGWVNMAGIQSYQRVYAFHLLGEAKDAVTLTVNVYYDYDTTTLPTTNTYTFSASAAGDLQFRGLLSKQKCQAIQIEVVDSDNGGSTDSGYTLTEIALELGLKSDGYRDSHVKLATTQTVGSNT